VTKSDLLAFLSDEQVQQLADNAFLAVFGVLDVDDNKFLFYENWFHNYTFERSTLYAVAEWPPFKRHRLDVR